MSSQRSPGHPSSGLPRTADGKRSASGRQFSQATGIDVANGVLALVVEPMDLACGRVEHVQIERLGFDGEVDFAAELDLPRRVRRGHPSGSGNRIGAAASVATQTIASTTATLVTFTEQIVDGFATLVNGPLGLSQTRLTEWSGLHASAMSG